MEIGFCFKKFIYGEAKAEWEVVFIYLFFYGNEG